MPLWDTVAWTVAGSCRIGLESGGCQVGMRAGKSSAKRFLDACYKGHHRERDMVIATCTF